MMYVKRTPIPDILAENDNWNIWGQKFAAKRTLKPSHSFSWKQHKKQNVGEIIRAALIEMHANHCVYCDGFPLGLEEGGTSRQTIEHFRPKSHSPDLSYAWDNLFLCCDVCQSIKKENYDEKLLKPDVLGYDFSLYFVFNSKDGIIDPNPALKIKAPVEYEKAVFTISFLKLNIGKRPENRTSLFYNNRRFNKRYNKSKKQNPDDLPYRFMYL